MPDPQLRVVSDVLTLTHAIEQALVGGPPVAPVADLSPATLAALRPDEPVTEPDVALVVATSGSTGRPKAVLLSQTALRAAAAATDERLGGPGTWHLALPAHYVAGAMVIARAVLAGRAPIQVASDLTDLSPVSSERNYLSVVPTQLVRAAADDALVARLAAFDAVLVGGAAAEAELLDRLRGRGVRLVETYGMSETCGGCVYDGRPLLGVSVHLDEGGRISLTTPTAFSGYRLRPDLTAEVLTGQTVRTQDRGRLDAERLTVLGRLDDVVISGGVNVDLAVVQRIVRTVAPEAVVVGVPDAEWGTRIAVLSPNPLTADELAELPLSPAARPRTVVAPVRLPLLTTGKIDRRACERLAQTPQERA